MLSALRDLLCSKQCLHNQPGSLAIITMTLGCVAAGVCTREGRALVSGLVNINLPKVYLEGVYI